MSKSIAPKDALTDFIILSNAIAQQIDRCELRIIQAKKMLAISKPVLFDLNITGIMGEKVSLQGVPFDQLDESLEQMLRTVLLEKILEHATAMRLSAVMRLNEVRAQIKILRSGSDS